jgi:uncharacterized protein
MTHPNEEIMRKGYAAFSAGDMDTVRSLFADDIVWHAQGRNQLAGEFRGVDAVLGTLAKTFELTGGTFKLDVHAMVADDEHVVVLSRVTGDREGRHLDDNSVQVWHMKDAKATEQWLYPGDPYATDEFWGN